MATEVAVVNDEVLKYHKLRSEKCIMNAKGSHPRMFYLPSECLKQAAMDDGAARAQKERYIQHIVKKQIKLPNSKSQDPMEGTLIYEEEKPWTHSREAFLAKLDSEPDFTDFTVSNSRMTKVSFYLLSNSRMIEVSFYVLVIPE